MGGLSGIGSVSARRIGAPQLREPAHPPAPNLFVVEAEPLVQRLLQLQTHARAAAHEFLDAQWVDVDVFGTSLELPITQDELRRDVVHSSALALERTETGGYRLRGLAQPPAPFQDMTITVSDDHMRKSTISLSVPKGDLVDAGSGQTLGPSQHECVAALLQQALQQEVSCWLDHDQPGRWSLRYEVPGNGWTDPPNVSVLLTVDPAGSRGCWCLLECMVFVVDRRGTSAVVRFPLDAPQRDAEPVSQPEAAVTEPDVPMAPQRKTTEPIEPPRKRARLEAGPKPLSHGSADACNASSYTAQPGAPSKSLVPIPVPRELNAGESSSLWRSRREEFEPLYMGWRVPHTRWQTGAAFLRELVLLCRLQHQAGHGAWIGEPSRGVLSFWVKVDGQALPCEIWIGVRNGETLDVELAPVDRLDRDKLLGQMARGLDRSARKRTRVAPGVSVSPYARQTAQVHWNARKSEFASAFADWQAHVNGERPDMAGGSLRHGKGWRSVEVDFLVAISAECDAEYGRRHEGELPPDGVSSHHVRLPGMPAPIEVLRRIKAGGVADLRLFPKDAAARQKLLTEMERVAKARDRLRATQRGWVLGTSPSAARGHS